MEACDEGIQIDSMPIGFSAKASDRIWALPSAPSLLANMKIAATMLARLPNRQRARI